jgi:hypothetical protein
MIHRDSASVSEECTRKRLKKRHKRQGTTVRRYRTQEVAGSSPASSTHKVPANRMILLDLAIRESCGGRTRTSTAGGSSR